jgi:hypothetical protein
MLKLLGLAAVAAAGAVLAANLPDLKRYLRIRTM